LLVIESDPHFRITLVAACQARGIPTRGVGCIAEIEKWPAGQIVVTDTAHLTPLWKEVRACAVVVLVDRPEEGIAAVANGATHWLSRDPGEAVHGLVTLGERLEHPEDCEDLSLS
jgi:hypothetical protein